GGDALVKVWDPATGKEAPALGARMTYDSFPTRSYAVTWAEGGKRLNVASSDGEIRILDSDSGKLITTRKLESRDPLERGGLTGTRPKRFIWGPDGKALASVESSAGDVSIWELATARQGPPIPTPGASGQMVFSMLAGACAPAWDRDG